MWSRLTEAEGHAERLILLAPIEPALTGNGLAMRTELFRRAATATFEVQVIVVPVAGRLPPGTVPAPGVRRVSPDPGRARIGARGLVADPAWRQRLAAMGDLPALARMASPGLADAVVDAVPPNGDVVLHVMRSYLAPLGVAVAERLAVRWLTLDLDEDDAHLAAAFDEQQEAAAYDRLLATLGSLFDGLSAASALEADELSRRHALVVDLVPNAVDVPARSASRPARSGASPPSILFVGNLTYAPNREAAWVLATEILPQIKLRLGPNTRLTLVGPSDRDLRRLAGPDVEVTGFVPDLAPIYAEADIVVVPLRSGAGTRIKLLEAFAHRTPVVASPLAAAGLAVSTEQHLLLADGAQETATAVERIVRDGALAGRLVEHAAGVVNQRYSTEVVVPMIRGMFAQAAAKARDRLLAG
jgi:glycosyltransferase involved in cell wall biosynthesis